MYSTLRVTVLIIDNIHKECPHNNASGHAVGFSKICVFCPKVWKLFGMIVYRLRV